MIPVDELPSLFAWAAYFMHLYTVPAVMPPVEYESEAYFRKGLWGTVTWDGTVHVREGVPWLDSVIVHEFCHTLQDPARDLCEREQECYRVQNEYLLDTGQPAIFRGPACPDEVAKTSAKE